MDLVSVASSGNVMMTNAAVSPAGRLFANFPRWTEVPTPSIDEATPEGGRGCTSRPSSGRCCGEWRRSRIPPVTGITADATGNLYFSAMTEDGVLKMEADGFYYFPNAQAPRVNRPYEAFKITLP